MKLYLCLVFLVSLHSASVFASRILLTSLMGTKSHLNMYVPLAKELAKRGHNITYLSNYEAKELSDLPNVRAIVFSEFEVDVSKFPNYFDVLFNPDYMEIFKVMYDAFFIRPVEVMEAVYKRPEVRQLLTDKDESFDLVMVSQAFPHSGYTFAWHFKAPMILMSPNVIFPGTAVVLGDSDHESYYPMLMTTFTDEMTLFQRTINVIANKLLGYLMNDHHKSKALSIFRREFSVDCPSLDEIEKNVSLVFTNSHSSFTYPRAYPPQVIEVGGLHCRPAKRLPAELDSFVSSADEGFIYFSAGTYLRLDDMPEAMMDAFINTFARLPQKVIWQWKGKLRNDLPKNVLPMAWLPQQDLLGHKNCRLFITHGGLNSLQESIYHGVPVLGLPFLADQSINLIRSERDGYALKLDWKDLTEDRLSRAIEGLLHNSSYKIAASRLSGLFRDQMESPLERAIYWAEFVLRHNGADHLRLGSRNLSFLQRNLVDVYFVLFIVGLIPVVLTFMCVRKCWSSGRRTGPSVVSDVIKKRQ